MWLYLAILGNMAILGSSNELNMMKPTVNTTDTEFYISYDHESIKSVLFYVKMNNMCPGKYSYAFNSSLSHPWVMQDRLNTSLAENTLNLYTLIVTSNRFLVKSYDIKINPSNDPPSTINIVDYKKKFKKISPICGKLKQRSIGTCLRTETISKSWKNSNCGGELIFNGTFVNAIDYGIWSAYNCAPINAVVGYTMSDNTAFIKEGNLHLRLQEVEKENYEVLDCKTSTDVKLRRNDFSERVFNRGYNGVKMTSKEKFSFKYGSINIRAKMPKGDWITPIIELTPNSNDNLSIRLALTRGNENLLSTENSEIGGKRIYGGVRHNEIDYLVDKISDNHHGDDFNDYTVIWHPDRIVYKINGATYGTIVDDKILSELGKHECFITLGITAGDSLDFPHQMIHIDEKEEENYVNFQSNKASLAFKEIDFEWDQPELVIKHFLVYSTHEFEE